MQVLDRFMEYMDWQMGVTGKTAPRDNRDAVGQEEQSEQNEEEKEQEKGGENEEGAGEEAVVDVEQWAGLFM